MSSPLYLCYGCETGVLVQVIGSDFTTQKKLTFTALIAFLGSFFLPFFVFRENRVASALVGELSLYSKLPLLIPPLLLIASLILYKHRFSRPLVPLSGALGIILPTFLLLERGGGAVLDIGPLARYSPGSGFYLYLMATVVIFAMQRRLTLYDYGALLLALLLLIVATPRDNLAHLSLILEAKNIGPRLGREIVSHIRITLVSLLVSVLVGLPLALLAFRRESFKKGVFLILNLGQTIPAIALFGLLIAPLSSLSQALPLLRGWGLKGIGNAPAILALSLYGLYPIVRYSYSAFDNIDSGVIESATGMGMTQGELWRIVRLPLATPTILNGVRVTLVQTIGNATLAKLIGGDGLGVLVFEGLGQASSDMVLLGMLLIVALTLIGDSLFQLIIFLTTPKALRRSYG